MSEYREVELCRPCVEQMKRQGKVLRPLARSNDQKGVCFWCCRRRFVGVYEVLKIK